MALSIGDMLAILAAVFAVLLAIRSVLLFHLRGRTLREQRECMRKSLWVVLLAWLAFVCLAWTEHNPMLALCWTIALLSMMYPAIRRPTEEDAQRDYARDPRHCGRCGYDLTGNVSGTCPECGWRIEPLPMLLVERPDWGLWWKQWPIEHLENPWSRLASAGGFAAAFLGLTIWFAVFKRTPFAILPAIAAVGLGIQVVRIVAYLMWQKNRSSKE